MNGERSSSGILRAVLEYDDRTEIRCAVDLEPKSIFVLTDVAPPIATEIALQLSFPGLLDPVAIHGRAVQVKVKENPGVQCGFVCTLDRPGTDVAHEIARLAQLPVREPRRLDVLLVEESRLLRDMFAYTLKKYFAGRSGTVRLETAHDANAAWDKLGSSQFDVVLVDHFLASESGASLIERMRTSRASKTPIIGVGVSGPQARIATLSAGADLFLEKPLVLRDLFRTFELLMARKDDRDRSH